MRNYIMGFITAVSLTVGVSSAYWNSQSVTKMDAADLKAVIYDAMSKALRDNRR